MAKQRLMDNIGQIKFFNYKRKFGYIVDSFGNLFRFNVGDCEWKITLKYNTIVEFDCKNYGTNLTLIPIAKSIREKK